ncbi:MAG: hydrogenase 4 subunit B, partial [Rhodocyclaceae bacterium]
MIGLIVLPLVWASLAFVLGPGRGKWLAIGGLALQTGLAFDLARKVGAGKTALTHAVGGWGAPLGIDLAA